jgi:hypothetical protein
MSGKIVLSYRRSDSDVITGRIRDNLANHYGEDAVFMDIDSIPLGFDYREQMRDALSDNKVMIAVIGPKWLGGRGKDARINANNDPVRIELETAFQQGMRIIPVLVSGATMPKASDLPQSLQGLCYINAGEVDGGRDFRQHMSRLIYAIDQILKTGESPLSGQISKTEPVSRSGSPPGSSPKWVPFALGAIACLLVTVGGIWIYFTAGSEKHDKCIAGYVWREAIPDDHVCVSVQTHEQTLQDNMLAGSRRNPSGGPYGPDTCLTGFVWREAFEADHVCVTPETRSRAVQDNRQGPDRIAR